MAQNRKKTILIAAVVFASVAAGGYGIAEATGPSDADEAEDVRETDTPIAGTDLDKASAAALAHTGEGRVTATEVGDEESYYEVEVTLDDGSQVDVQLDEEFDVVGDEREDGGEDD